jgi:hypothetical protein
MCFTGIIFILNFFVRCIIGLIPILNPQAWWISGLLSLISGGIGCIGTLPCGLCICGGLAGWILDFLVIEGIASLIAFFLFGGAYSLIAIGIGILLDILSIPLYLRTLTPGGFLQIINILKQSLNSMLNLLTL